MRNIFRKIGIPVVLFLCLTAFDAFADVRLGIDSEHDVVIDEIRLEGNQRNADEDLLYYIRHGRGQKLNPDLVSKDIKRLFGIRLFDDIQVDLERIDDKNILIYRFLEKPAIAEILIEGNDEYKSDDLLKEVDLKVASPLNEDKINRGAEALRNKYKGGGFFLAEVTPKIEKIGDSEVKVVYVIREFDKVRVKTVNFIGNKNLSSDKLKASIYTREASLFGKLSGAGEFKQEEFDNDVKRIAALYSDNGYPDARVTDSFVNLSEDRRTMGVTFKIEEGKYTTVNAVSVTGDILEYEAFTDITGKKIAGASKEEIDSLVTVEAGEGFKLSKLFADVKRIQDYYADRGYAYASVEPRRIAADTPDTLNIIFNVTKGKRMRIGRINIIGNEKTQDKVIRRELPFYEGDLYHGSRVQMGETFVTRTGYFEKVSITSQASETNDEYVDIVVEVKERPTGSFQIGAGFSSAEKFIGTMQLSQENFLGRGQYLSASGTLSGIRQLFSIQFFEPYFLDSKWRLRASIFNYEYSYTDFKRASYGGSVGFGYPLWRDLVADITYTFEQVKVKADASLGQQQRNIGSLFDGGRTSSVNFSLTWDSRNNRLFPSEGYMFQGVYEQADEFIGSENEFIRLIGRARAYYNPVWDFVLKFNLEIGIIGNWNAGKKEVPIFERFFVGGPNSVRGFERSTLGPTRSIASDISDPAALLTKFNIGGNKEFFFNAELEIPVSTALGIKAVAFFDMGNAFNDDQSISLKPDWFAKYDDYDSVLRTSAGFGLRWLSPMGLLRFEWGFPLAKKPSEETFIFEFSIGNSF